MTACGRGGEGRGRQEMRGGGGGMIWRGGKCEELRRYEFVVTGLVW